MTTNLEVIEDALREINVISEIDSASAEQGTYGLKTMNELLELWTEAQDINIGWFAQSATGDTSPVPLYAMMAVKAALAIAMASKYGASVSVELAAKADYAFSALQRKSISEKPEMDNTDMSHLPEGLGHWGNRYDITTDST